MLRRKYSYNKKNYIYKKERKHILYIMLFHKKERNSFDVKNNHLFKTSQV